MHTPFDLAIPFLIIYPKDKLAQVRNDVCKRLFIAGVFTKTSLETTQMPINRNLVLKTIVHLYSGKLWNCKKNDNAV